MLQPIFAAKAPTLNFSMGRVAAMGRSYIIDRRQRVAAMGRSCIVDWCHRVAAMSRSYVIDWCHRVAAMSRSYVIDWWHRVAAMGRPTHAKGSCRSGPWPRFFSWPERSRLKPLPPH